MLFTAAEADGYPVRTLWRTVFDVTDRTIAIRFYMGDSDSGEPQYSAETTFSPVRR